MHDLFMGLITLAFISFLGALIYLSGEITILIIGALSIFAIIGVYLTINGIKEVAKNKKTNSLGEEGFGFIITTEPSGTIVNGVPLLNAKILVLKKDFSFQEFVEFLENDSYKYSPGEYVKVKYFENDANILGKVDKNSVSYRLTDYVNEHYKAYTNDPEEVIYIDDEEYIREDLINK